MSQPSKTVLLLRHARSTANAQGVLAGRAPDVHLDERGEKQARKLAEVLAPVPVEFIVHSDLTRTRETVLPWATSSNVTLREDARITECDYGTWTGRELKTLADEPLWKTIQSEPSAVTFPEGESMVAMQQRAIESLNFWREEATSLFALCSHGDVLKALVAHAIGLPLDEFQTLHVQPASLSVLRWDGHKWSLVLLNHTVSENIFDLLTLPISQDIGGGDVRA